MAATKFRSGRTVPKKESRLMVRVRQPHRYDHMADPQVERIRKMFRDMKLFQSHFTAFFRSRFRSRRPLYCTRFPWSHRFRRARTQPRYPGTTLCRSDNRMRRRPGATTPRAVIARRPDRIRIPVRSVSHVLEQDFPASADTILFEVPLERRFRAAELAVSFAKHTGRAQTLQQTDKIRMG